LRFWLVVPRTRGPRRPDPTPAGTRWDLPAPRSLGIAFREAALFTPERGFGSPSPFASNTTTSGTPPSNDAEREPWPASMVVCEIFPATALAVTARPPLFRAGRAHRGRVPRALRATAPCCRQRWGRPFEGPGRTPGRGAGGSSFGANEEAEPQEKPGPRRAGKASEQKNLRAGDRPRIRGRFTGRRRKRYARRLMGASCRTHPHRVTADGRGRRRRNGRRPPARVGPGTGNRLRVLGTWFGLWAVEKMGR